MIVAGRGGHRMRSVSEDCLFCSIVAGDIPATVVLETATTLAFRDINPQAPTHVVVVPRAHYPTIAALAQADPGLTAEVLQTASAVAQADGVAESGYRIVFNTGPGAGQTVFHVHAHLLGGRAMTWPPG
jgi:histidine triad (HIT) family protein